MAHIADLLLAIATNGAVTIKPKSALPSPVSLENSESPTTEEKDSSNELHTWRLHNADNESQAAKFQSPSLEKAESTARPKDADNKSPQMQSEFPASRLKFKQTETKLNSRRKISVPELGPMTTVNESAMDSPTIPGRPPIHGRSLSLPVTSPYDPSDEGLITALYNLDSETNFMNPTENAGSCNSNRRPTCSSMETNPTFSHDRNPTSKEPNLLQNNLNLNSRGSENPLRSTKGSHQESHTFSNMPKVSPLATILAWSSAVTSSSNSEGRSSPRPWNFGRSSPKPWSITSRSSPKSSPRVTQDTVISLPMPPITPPYCIHPNTSEQCLHLSPSKNNIHSSSNHSRHESDDGNSLRVSDRGRPQRRPQGEYGLTESQSRCSSSNPTISTSASFDDERSTSPSSPSEQQCFLSLPTGYSSSAVCQNLSQAELSHLQNQALSQARRFRILPSRDVESLSRELRALDERCEYLRSTHHNLRNERKSLHARICSYLRSHRVARFSVESLLKQEETLAELDRSIDNWICKLEQAENRRMRIRQKLLEHVAAAAILEKNNGCLGQNTPPRSPQHSPDRLERVLEEDLLREDLLTPSSSHFNDDSSAKYQQRPSSPSQQSIRIYADNDVYALMDCVEEEIVRLGM
ncbi:hypothetical protein K3495_g3821 [Podosphaera aphanis]|nr:hypothetical protein K3495_g3821 [Podosphaera aphanis]